MKIEFPDLTWTIDFSIPKLGAVSELTPVTAGIQSYIKLLTYSLSDLFHSCENRLIQFNLQSSTALGDISLVHKRAANLICNTYVAIRCVNQA